ncbi:hypothetical protein EJ05DRAFT_508127 [Pseudovirgaria hyperparasitica]|uniref:Zn(2)-C6 fungal-type domain-containing protein n=1 Tax=Pseudovirgaria hyperparasitica TaxID=470096 RepID=A0A6A6WFT9_9PEZI|nr:uncharacterized protein EJ05DRAFT_508127 [Pseudovirgaria hyperparasitica]KAF2760890.1 hypothetical protein EJ05DRAFT_508127 [Pseudovirgaria hyperparasitica]
MSSRNLSLGSSVEAVERKRVCKACDRCRLKKSKCDGSQPCLRCKSDNVSCLFGERKRAQDKVYPKGYVEMLEHQQAMLVRGMRNLYQRCVAHGCWEGEPLETHETTGHPLVHSMLLRLDALYMVSSAEFEEGQEHIRYENYGPFEENYPKMRTRLLEQGASLRDRRGASIGSDSDHGSSNVASPISPTGNSWEQSVITPITPPTNDFFPQAHQQSIKQEPTHNRQNSFNCAERQNSYSCADGQDSFSNPNWASTSAVPDMPMLAAETWPNNDTFFGNPSMPEDNILAYDQPQYLFNNNTQTNTQWDQWAVPEEQRDYSYGFGNS